MYVDDQTTGLLDAEQHYRNAQPIRLEFYRECGRALVKFKRNTLKTIAGLFLIATRN
tara:strand:- start:690 stop:860 length:171 start_codon:yes stop_codon:yes gene_type:complete